MSQQIKDTFLQALECGNTSYRFRMRLTADRGEDSAVSTQGSRHCKSSWWKS
ncbi:MAG: hypothetical protein V8R75_02645 [Oscillospiraceae bacterium]